MTGNLTRKTIRTAGVLGAAVMMFGCAGAKIDLAEDTLASLRITEVNVTAAPNARIRWDEEAGRYLRAKGIKRPRGSGGRARDDNPEVQNETNRYLSALNSGETRQHVQSAFLSKVRVASQSAVANWPRGHRPARLNVVVHSASEASPFVQVVIGPSSSSVHTKVTLVDAQTGAVFGKPRAISGVSTEAGGFIGVAIAAARSPKMDRVVEDYSANLQRWLGAKKQ